MLLGTIVSAIEGAPEDDIGGSVSVGSPVESFEGIAEGHTDGIDDGIDDGTDDGIAEG